MSSLQERIGWNKYQQELLDPLIRLLVDGGHSQQAIAEILNARGLFRVDDKLWNQVAVCRYCKAEGITSSHSFFRTSPTQLDQAIQGQANEIQQQT